MIHFNEILFDKKKNYLRTVFITINDYPTQLVNNFINNELQKRKISNNVTNNNKIATSNNKIKEEKI